MNDLKLKMIYKPKGKAGEYADYALNIYNGCEFACNYCFAPIMLKKDKNVFHTNISERKSFLIKVENDCKKLEGLEVNVLLCFVCDPYTTIDDTLMLTREVLKLFKKHNINFTILTKSGLKAIRDFDLYKDGDCFASTLTFVNEEKSKEWEPNAALPKDRFEALKKAHELGIETWVSLEPVIDPFETLKIIELTKDFVDLYKVGTLNYHELSDTINWKEFGEDAIALLEKYNKKYYIKDDLKKYMN